MPSLNLPAGDAKRCLVSRDRIMTIKEWCERSSFSTVTGWRLMKAGQGPKLTRISERRLGIREDHYREWLDSRKVRSTIQK
jgi:predicted DNA-binding transcriptional regulator AlpA